MKALPFLLACLALFDAAAVADETVQLQLSASDAAANAEYAYALAGAGDVNADGLYDLVVGAHQDSAAGVDAGAAYLYLGEEAGDLSSSELKLLEPEATAGGLFGAAVAGAGDTDGDGYGDLAIGAPGSSAVYIFPGRSTGVSIEHTAKLTADGMSGLGYAVAGAGDLDGDGFADVALGACLVSGASVSCDGVVVLLGAASLGRPDLQILANSSGLGNALAGTSDVDGDGYADLLVGHRNASEAGANSGSARIWWGGAGNLTDFTDYTATDPAAGDNFGVSVAGAGDVDDDGFDDFLVGASQRDQGTVSNVGAAYLFLGGPERGSSEQIDLSPPAIDANSFFGTSVAGLGDRDGDGFDDFLVGAPGGWSGTINGGNAYAWAGGSSGMSSDSPVELVASNVAGGDRFGRAAAGPGDVDGDGHPDVLIGAYDHGTSPLHAGAAYVFLAACVDGDGDGFCGNDDCDDDSNATWPGVAWRDSRVDCMADVDGDGFGDADPPANVTAGTDCDDQHADTFPGAAVLDDPKACTTDADGDGFGDADPAQGVSAGTDCDDSDALVNPAATEICNGIDDDCNGQLDIDAVDISYWVPDADGDGWTQDTEPTLACTAPDAEYQQASYLPDCDDTDASVHPGAQELPDDGIDQDCNGADMRTVSPDKGCAVLPGQASAIWVCGLLGLALRRRRH